MSHTSSNDTPLRQERNIRLARMLLSPKFDPSKIQFLDCFNQCAYTLAIPTLLTRIDSSNHYWLSVPAPSALADTQAKECDSKSAPP